MIPSLAGLFAATAVMAQDTKAATEQTVTSGTNLLVVLLVIMACILAFVIWGLGQILLVLSKQLLEKNRNTAKIIAVLLVTGFLLSSQPSMAQDAAKTVKVVSNYGGLSETGFYMFGVVVLVEVVAILFLAFSIKRVYGELKPVEATAPKASWMGEWWDSLDKKLFTRAVPVEQEADVLLDHDYDGIKELDNALPPWWKYGFYITIVVAVIYIFNFHVMGNGKNPTEEYLAEMQTAKIEKEAYDAQNKDKIDENNVPKADAAGLAAAKEIFTSKCWACHGKAGEGGAGPNLTDDYWLHKGSLNDVYRSIKNGYPDKGMQSWATVYTPKEMSYLASFVKSLHGTNPPNPKAPQGDLYTEAAAVPASADSSKSATPVKDSLKTK